MVEEVNDDMKPSIPSLVTHVHPSECTSVMATMKAVITGFVDRQDDEFHQGPVQSAFFTNCMVTI